MATIAMRSHRRDGPGFSYSAGSVVAMGYGVGVASISSMMSERAVDSVLILLARLERLGVVVWVTAIGVATGVVVVVDPVVLLLLKV